MQQEEPREPEPADHPQLLLEPPRRLGALAGARVAELQPPAADLGQRPVGVGVLGARIAVAELRGEVEAQALGEPRGLGDRVGVVGKARRHLRRRREHRARVAAPLGLRLLQRRVQAHGDERVLELGPAAVVGSGRCRSPRRRPRAARRAPPASGCARGRAATAAAAARSGSARARRRRGEPPRERLRPSQVAALPGAGERSGAGAAGEADEPLVALEQRVERQRRGEGVAIRTWPRLGVRLGQQPAEVVPARSRSRPAA